MNILAISYSFPHASRPFSGVFVKNTLAELVKQGHSVTVICPQNRRYKNTMNFSSIVDGIRVLRPKFLSCGAKSILGLNTYTLTQFFFNRSVKKSVIQLDAEFDVVYSHFLLPSGFAALEISSMLSLPVYCVLGENSLLVHEKKMKREKLINLYEQFDGLIFNGPHTKKLAIDLYGIAENKCTFIPNGVQESVFFPHCKIESRKKLGLSQNQKIVIFVGGFIERKGPLRVLNACESLDEQPKMIFIGSGAQNPESPNVIFSGSVEHDLLPYYLSASDVFVLPTTNEGMPNAVMEAMACGCLVVTSSIEPNVYLLGDSYPYYCEPFDENNIANKIEIALKSLNQTTMPKPPSTKERASAIIELMSKSCN